MAYPTELCERAMTLYREYPDMQARQVLNQLKKDFPEQPLPDIRTISGWRQKPRAPRAAKQKSLLRQFLGTHHPADVAAAIEVHLGHLLRRAQNAPDQPLRLKYYLEPDAYQRSILETIERSLYNSTAAV